MTSVDRDYSPDLSHDWSEDSCWIFGYGSLMWNHPEFESVEQHHADLNGYRRDLCMYSFMTRGTPELPGLCLGLTAAEGEACIGIAFRIESKKRDAAWKALQERENTPLVCYRAVTVQVSLRCDERRMRGDHSVSALVFLPLTSHVQYAGKLTDDEKLNILRDQDRRGTRGTSLEYLRMTIESLQKEVGIRDEYLDWLMLSSSTPNESLSQVT
ncbi:ChaC-like protein [Planoprotostelium fungivorum]|uniref:glutathione-specific gamma-glutamylcyclotransferase n=1 Tax=Planoprotostelium fungivorum TaxID=1890364 RepID=A0A2P6N321_9EUKA|nr:ChaC-like protein [Planoprotostelium fungivorum]